MHKWLLLIVFILASCVPAAPLDTFQVPEPVVLPQVEEFTVRVHPDQPLYVGDRISFEVIAPGWFEGAQAEVRVSLHGSELGRARFGRHGLSGRKQATQLFVWNTTNLAPGSYELLFEVFPDGIQWQQVINLLPQDELPLEEANAHWSLVQTLCCSIYYITSTDAERDLEAIKGASNQQASLVSERLQKTFEDSIPVVVLPRTVGHGGFASSRLYISYLDRNYAGSNPAHVLMHEMVHWLDRQLGGDFRPAIFVEGLAVYISGGHYKVEPIVPRAAALISLGWYLPLTELADDFYFHQHEISYIEAGALVAYLVETYGWEAFSDFYRTITHRPGVPQSAIIDRALNDKFNITLEELDGNFRKFLLQQELLDAHRDDVRLTVQFYDTVRRYQGMLDPSAYFLTAWLPDDETMRREEIVADYFRHPDTPLNRYLEWMLVDGHRDLINGRYEQAEFVINSVNTIMDAASWFGIVK